MRLYLMTLDQALKFFEEASYREAITPEEREKILVEMAKNGDLLEAFSTDASKEEVVNELSKYCNILEIKKKKNEAS